MQFNSFLQLRKMLPFVFAMLPASHTSRPILSFVLSFFSSRKTKYHLVRDNGFSDSLVLSPSKSK